jgi:hypothetical protein
LGIATEKLRGELGQAASDSGTKLKELNDQVRDTTGFDAQATAANAATTAVNAAGDASAAAAAKVAQAASAFSGAADQSDRAAASAANLARHNQAVAEAAQLGSTLTAARQNEIGANRALVDMKYAQVQLAGDEAQIRLQMLPTQQRMLELQNQTAQAQLRANQAALPSSRALQDLQNQIRLNTLIAQSGDIPMAQRQQALATATSLTRQVPGAEIAALQGQIGALPAGRAAEDVANAARQQALEQQAALSGDEYQRQTLDLLSQVATAAKAAAQRTIQLTVQGINVILSGAGVGNLTDTDYNNIVQMVGQAVADAIFAAAKTVDQRNAPPQLLAAGGPV